MRFLPAIFMLLFSALGCGSERAPELAPAGETGPEDTEEACVPGGTVQAQPQTASQYVEMCEPELGVPPDFDCAAGVTLPITVDGVEVSEPVPNFACDAPSLQDGECFPGSTINRLPGQTRGGVEREEVVWVQFCRNEGSVEDDGEVSFIFTGAQMIGHNTETGATCFFELNVGPQSQWVGRDENLRAQGVLPSHDDPDFDKAFVPPGHVQCVQCHQNDPFVHHPWVDGARLPSDPSEPVLPILPADAPYYIVGGSDRDMRTIHIEGNACLSCHRVGMEIDQIFAGNGFDVNTYMPPSAPGSLSDDYAALLDCWKNGPEATEGCDWIIPPAGDCEGGVVGPDYPYAAALFNQPGKGDDGGGVDGDACGPEVVLGEPCEGDPLTTACLVDGEWFWCENGVWTNEK
jgi:hypothetical protein